MVKREMTKQEREVNPKRTGGAEYNCSLPGDRCSAQPQAVNSPSQPDPHSSYTGCDIVWHGLATP